VSGGERPRLRDFDRVRERVELRLEPRVLWLLGLGSLAAVAGSFELGRRTGHSEASAADAAPARSLPGEVAGLDLRVLPGPERRLGAPSPLVPRRWAGADPSLAPLLSELAGGRVAGAQARVASAEAVAEATAEDAPGLQSAAVPDAPAGQAAEAGSPTRPSAASAAPARALPDFALRCEPGQPGAALQSRPPAADTPCLAGATYAPLASADGRPLRCDADQRGQTCEDDDPRAYTRADLSPAGLARLAGARAAPEGTPSASGGAPDAPGAAAELGADPVEEGSDPAAPEAATATAAGPAGGGGASTRRLEPPARYVLQVKALRNEPEARMFRDDLVRGGFEAYVQRAEVADQGVFFRVRIGPVASAARAAALQRQLQQETGHEALVLTLRSGERER
jgi:cell division septation protein DedD